MAAQSTRQDGFIDTVAGALSAEQVAGRLTREVDVRYLATRVAGAINGVAVQAGVNPGAWPPVAQRLAVDELLESLRPARRRRSA